ncbi:MAG: hypothetical protein K8I65_15040, partial [Thermoanaerobaculia bacterium]|nr:hypothetical protein [Thermoanaerobaculia bacterium]
PPTSTRTTPDPAIVTLPAPGQLACLPSRAATRPILRPLPGIGNSNNSLEPLDRIKTLPETKAKTHRGKRRKSTQPAGPTGVLGGTAARTRPASRLSLPWKLFVFAHEGSPADNLDTRVLEGLSVSETKTKAH